MLPHSSELLKEVEALKVENEALKAQLSKELEINSRNVIATTA